MPTMQDLFQQMTQVLLETYEQQRALHTSAYGQPNSIEIVQKAEANGKQLERWREDLQVLAKEMEESALFAAPSRRAGKVPVKVRRGKVKKGVAGYIGKKPVAVELFGKREAVSTWREVLFFVLEELFIREPALVLEFEHNTTLNKKRMNFSRDQGNITRAPIYSKKSGLYVETNHGAESIMGLCSKMIAACGLDDRDFQVFTKQEEAGI